MVRGCKEEAKAVLVDRERDPLGRELEREAEGLEDVGRALRWGAARAPQRRRRSSRAATRRFAWKTFGIALESEVKARRTVQEAIHANEQEMDQTELILLLEQEMLEAARNLEFERAAQLRDKVNEIKGAPTIRSGNPGALDGDEGQKIWQPKSKGRGGKRKVAK